MGAGYEEALQNQVEYLERQLDSCEAKICDLEDELRKRDDDLEELIEENTWLRAKINMFEKSGESLKE